MEQTQKRAQEAYCEKYCPKDNPEIRMRLAKDRWENNQKFLPLLKIKFSISNEVDKLKIPYIDKVFDTIKELIPYAAWDILIKLINKYLPVPITIDEYSKIIRNDNMITCINTTINKMDDLSYMKFVFNMSEFEDNLNAARVDYWLKYGYTIINKSIATFVFNNIEGEALEICAGKGLLAFIMRKMGKNYIATDNFSWTNNPYFAAYTDVINMKGEDAVQKYKSDTLIISWPCRNDPCAYNSLKLFKGDRLIYIGDTCGGCCAEDNFFDRLDEYWELMHIHPVPPLHINHYIFVYVFQRNK